MKDRAALSLAEEKCGIIILQQPAGVQTEDRVTLITQTLIAGHHLLDKGTLLQAPQHHQAQPLQEQALLEQAEEKRGRMIIQQERGLLLPDKPKLQGELEVLVEGAGRMIAQQDHGPQRQGRPLTPGAVEILVHGAVEILVHGAVEILVHGAVVVTVADTLVTVVEVEAETLAVVTVEWDTRSAMLIPTEESKSFLFTF